MTDQVSDHGQGGQIMLDLREEVVNTLTVFPSEYAVPTSFPIIDAALWNFCQNRFKTFYSQSPHPLRIERESFTSGSALYVMQSLNSQDPDEVADIAVLEVRMATENSTYLAMGVFPSVSAAVRPEQRDFLNALCRWILASFLQYFRDDQTYIASLPKELDRDQKLIDLNTLRTVPAEIHTAFHRPRGGRPRQSDDDWAWGADPYL